ncbi:spermidine synthase [Rothia halotolerans]|uniref:spermidine synthase n=1 Tax=Rothia halotolerans TaxID=405770 RepID=UPI00101BC8E4|nr:fused MFS/spermidine synthase [Rothia halotolerans]
MSGASRSVQLSLSGLTARILPDGFSESGRVLEIGGAEQSHVDPAHPERIFYEYLHRVGAVADAMAPAGEPLSAAHLGAGGLTLPRYLQATRPGSAQVAVEIERELPSLVLDALPLPPGTRLRILNDDARAALPGLAAAAGLAPGEGLDLLVVDIFSGRDAPPHLACEGFYREALEVLGPRGILLVNVGDDAGLSFFAAQATALTDAVAHRGSVRDAAPASGPWTLTDASLLSGRREGNLILAAGPGLGPGARIDPREQAEAWRRAGPHPAAVLDPLETEGFVRSLE